MPTGPGNSAGRQPGFVPVGAFGWWTARALGKSMPPKEPEEIN
jgi:hypothetical protein